MRRVILALFIVSAMVTSLFAGSTPPPPPEPVSNAIDPMFNKYVSLGDSLTHGMQSAAVDETRQPLNYVSLLSEMMETEFDQGLVEFPGYFLNIEDHGKSNISWWQYSVVLLGGDRVDDFDDQDRLNNFGIVGADITTIQESSSDEGEFFRLALGKNGAPAVDQAMDKDPRFVTVWLGNNDTLGCALHTDLGELTSLSHFQQKYAELVQTLQVKSSIEGVAVANIPDVAAIAYLEPANDPDVPAGSMKAFWNSSVSGNDEVLDPGEMSVIRQRTAQFNEIIRDFAAANGWAFIDANAIFEVIKVQGHALKDSNGLPTSRVVTADYLGGIFSLDGVHMSTTGYAIVANFFSEAIDSTYGTDLGFVNEYQVSNNDTLYQDPYDPRGLIDSWIGQAVQFVIELF